MVFARRRCACIYGYGFYEPYNFDGAEAVYNFRIFRVELLHHIILLRTRIYAIPLISIGILVYTIL